MSAFEFFFSFYGLILGLSVVEVITGLVRVLKQRRRVRIGWLTPLLALFVLLDIASFWIGAWSTMQDVKVSYGLIFVGLVIAGIYYAAASLVTPDDLGEWPDFDDFYDRHKRWVLGGVVIANFLAFEFVRMISDGGLAAWAARFAVPSVWISVLFNYVLIILLMFVRNRRANIVFLAFGVGMYLVTAIVF